MKKVEEVIAKCIKKDSQAQSELYELCFDRLMQTCMRFHNNRADAVALLNEGFLKILLNLEKYDSQHDFFPWIGTIMVRMAVDEFRKSKNYRAYVDLPGDMVFEENAESLAVYNHVVDKMERDEVDALIQALPSHEKVVFNLYVMENYSHVEIAEMLGCSTRTSKRYLNSARELLRAEFEKKTRIKRVG